MTQVSRRDQLLCEERQLWSLTSLTLHAVGRHFVSVVALADYALLIAHYSNILRALHKVEWIFGLMTVL